MDAVITYVNGMEPNWRLQYNTYVGGYMVENKFLDYGTLKFVLRGISEHMKFIDRIFLVVSSLEQVPDYINNNVIIITHEQFIPKEYLPTFNANTIETFLWNIPDLSDQFIFFNDDMIPIGELEYEDFFKNEKPCISFREKKTESFQFNNIIFYDNILSCLISKFKERKLFLWNYHIMTPFLKKEYYNAYLYNKKQICERITPLRSSTQISQHYFSNWLYYSDNYNEHYISHTYLNTKIYSQEFKNLFKEINAKVICINDNGPFLDKTVLETYHIINDELFKKMPNKCKYEK